MSYKLLLVGDLSDEKFTSCEFFTKELIKRFSQLSHISLEKSNFNVQSKDLPNADIALFHCYENSPAISDIYLLNNKYKKTVYFMEIPKRSFHKSYCYGPSLGYFKNISFIKPPVVKSYFEFTPKEKNSILLDHDVKGFPIYRHSDLDWNERIWDFFYNKNFDVWQLERGDVKRPSFIKTIAISDYQTYLTNTNRFERFVCTHSGSFNHTAVDMAVRGTQVITPDNFLSSGLINNFDMSLISSLDELETVLKRPFEPSSKLDKTIDLDEVVEIMDHDFQDMLFNHNRINKPIILN